ncbi:MAG: hypothetical protein AW10_02793 [Candidatus Accumulibacter appositus]|uniref:Uncharacterized protein n=1 Tax=Candidatus Accumulibacter appositus TaxID=1454003 RepID=A0A011N887_9PROT|nr:hypothetical protein [Accumulibacter sp.]EXI78803.1 MAG: hypothetical protein AW10_02793 [Candidatus Accumulibacter appositus]HRF05813.1 hypothetical protein [Accumulibacter sp.]
MLIVPRRVREVKQDRQGSDPPLGSPTQSLEEYREQAAWILLGEPGAGKSSAFEQEAEAHGGIVLAIAAFLEGVETEWQGKTLFLDGLDETRTGGGDDSILFKIRARLKQLGNPPFRIACRAADWFGSGDQKTMAGASPDGQLAVLLLEPLNDEEILDILRSNHGVEAPEAFVNKASEHGVDGLLSNPQTLGLLAQAVRGDQWPATREQTFELACQKLAEEANRLHRNKLRGRPPTIEKLLDAAGQLFAVLLLANKTGIALDREAADARFPALEDFSPPDPEMAAGAVRSKLFRPSASREERVEPIHRSISEFLAARWLGQQIDMRGLPLGRVLNLLLGTDGRTVAGLRGLYGWLALHCHAARPRLIDADPLTVVIYGDVKPMPRADKQRILAGLRREAARHTAFAWQVQTSHPYGALADPELIDDFVAVLKLPERDDATQACVSCVLQILLHGERLSELANTVLALVSDDTRWGRVRTCALEVWIKLDGSAQQALALLDAIASDQIADSDDELAGILLGHLYPQEIRAADLLRFWHTPKDRDLAGSFAWFWGHELPNKIPDSHLPIVLDQLALRSDLQSPEGREFHTTRMVSRLLGRGVVLHGEGVSNERLFGWLRIGVDEWGDVQTDEEDRKALAGWLEDHPERHKSLLSLCFKESEGKAGECFFVSEGRLHGATAPNDIGLWHLEQAAHATSDSGADRHLYYAVNALMYQRGSLGLTLEKIEEWGEAHPARKHLLPPHLAWDVTAERQDRAARAKVRRLQRSDTKRERSIRLAEHLNAIRSGTANVALLNELAGVWLNRYSDTSGETALERFDSYCENGQQLLAAAEAGFRQCVERDGLPSVEEIIDLGVEQREHFIRQPCLLGMELRWRTSPEGIAALPDHTLHRMVAFRLTYGVGNSPPWFSYLVEQQPSVVADVLMAYVNAGLKAKQEFSGGSYPLAHDPNYGEVARIAVPRLLERFPLRARSGQLRHLEYLLKAALRYSLEQLPALVEKKIATKSMDVAQKVYWLAAAMLVDPAAYEAALLGYVGNSANRANYLSSFLSKRFGGLNNEYQLSASIIGKLIEVLAPHAELEFPQSGGWVNEAMQRGDQIRTLVRRLGVLGTDAATQEVERLLSLPTLTRLTYLLENTRHQLRLQRRESSFAFPPLAGVVTILANHEPASAADLAALTLDHLDDIARDIRTNNDDGFRAFWNVENRQPTSEREENLCRDELLTRLGPRLASFGVDCQPEGDYFNDKRADMRVSYRNQFACPIEVKGEWHDSLWTALRSQLIEQYALDPKAAGYGIYLVLWFGGKRQRGAKDQGSKPTSPEELRERLQSQLDPVEQKRIFVRVLDVSWPVMPQVR